MIAVGRLASTDSRSRGRRCRPRSWPGGGQAVPAAGLLPVSRARRVRVAADRAAAIMPGPGGAGRPGPGAAGTASRPSAALPGPRALALRLLRSRRRLSPAACPCAPSGSSSSSGKRGSTRLRKNLPLPQRGAQAGQPQGEPSEAATTPAETLPIRNRPDRSPRAARGTRLGGQTETQ